jgi:hypothetical protein
MAMMVLTRGQIKRHRYSFATLAAIRRASTKGSRVTHRELCKRRLNELSTIEGFNELSLSRQFPP